MRRFLPMLLVLLASPVARAATAADTLRTTSEAKARAEITDLFHTLCPEQCVLLSVTATVEEQPATGAEPGFEAVNGDARVPVLQSIDAAVLIDNELPAPFRSRLRDVLDLRLKEIGAASNNIAVQPLAFPSRVATTPPAPLPQPAPVMAPAPERPAALPTPVATAPAPVRLRSRLLEEAPALIAVGILAATLLVLGALLFVGLRRQPALPEWTYDEGEPPSTTSPPTAEVFPIARAQRLEKTLTDERALRNEVIRSALSNGETALVAQWTREFGEFLVADLAAESTLQSSLNAVAAELGRAPNPAQRTQALYELEGRVLALRLSRTAEPAERLFSFLEGVRPERFSSAAQAVSQGARELGLRLAPASLRTFVLRTLSAAERADLALAWAQRIDVTPAYAAAAADEWRAALAASAGGLEQSERAVESLLELLPRSEQDRLLTRLHAEGHPRFGRSLLTESHLLKAPPDAVTSALLAIPSERLVTYFARADVELRDALLERCPEKLQAELQEELARGVFVTREEFYLARRALLSALREELNRRGQAMDHPEGPSNPPRLTVVAG